MKRTFILLVSLMLATACASPAPDVSEPAPAETTAVQIVNEGAVIASADVQPVQVVDLSFTVSALVKEVTVQEGDTVNAGDVLMTLSMPDLEFAVIAAENDYNARALDAQLQKAERVLYVDPNTGVRRWYAIPREVYEKALSKADQSKAVWDTAIANLAQATLSAPFGGTVVDVRVIPGELVQVNQVAIVVANLEKLEVVTSDLSERDIARVKIGQLVTVTIEALGVSVPGKVAHISPISEIVGGDIVYPVTIELDEQPDGLLWGMSAEVEITTK